MGPIDFELGAPAGRDPADRLTLIGQALVKAFLSGDFEKAKARSSAFLEELEVVRSDGVFFEDWTWNLVVWAHRIRAELMLELPEYSDDEAVGAIEEARRVMSQYLMAQPRHRGSRAARALGLYLEAVRLVMLGDSEEAEKRVLRVVATARTGHLGLLAWEDGRTGVDGMFCHRCTWASLLWLLSPERVEAWQVEELLEHPEWCRAATEAANAIAARVYLRDGRLEEARDRAEKAMVLCRGEIVERRKRPPPVHALVAALEVAVAMREASKVRELLQLGEDQYLGAERYRRLLPRMAHSLFSAMAAAGAWLREGEGLSGEEMRLVADSEARLRQVEARLALRPVVAFPPPQAEGHAAGRTPQPARLIGGSE